MVSLGTQTAPVGFQKQLQVAPGRREVWGSRGAAAAVGQQGAACGRERRLAGLRLTLASVCDPNRSVPGAKGAPIPTHRGDVGRRANPHDGLGAGERPSRFPI